MHLGKLWNLPNTIIGLIVLYMYGKSTFKEMGENHYVAKLWSRFNLHMKRINKSAITLGEIVLYRDRAFTKKRINHELVHVNQGRTWGIFFLPLYIIASIVSRVIEGNWHEGNIFEKQARKKAKGDINNVWNT